jgi:lysophospholipase L1-like esterase
LSARSRWVLSTAAALALAWPLTTGAQNVSGTTYEDRDADGIHDVDEPSLPGVAVRLFGTLDAGGAFDDTVASAADGGFAFAPGDGCFLLGPVDPAGWRLAPARRDTFPETTPGYLYPVGQPRLAKLDQAVANLQAGGLRYSALGDSIAANFNVFCGSSSFWYSRQLRSRLTCVAPSANIPAVDEAAILGQHSDDLLVDDADDLNNVFRMIDAQPQLISLSIIGNDLLDVDPGDGGTQQEVNRAVAEILDARRNIQEALSSFASEIPSADVILNTLYDNEAFACSPTDFHRTWVPIVAGILRDLAWGQTRRFSNAEIAAEFAQVDQTGACAGFEGMICDNFLDGIHPTSDGYTIIREKLWEAAGGVSLGAGDALMRSSLPDADYGYLRRVRRLLPRAFEINGGAVVATPEAALRDDDDGASAGIALGNGVEEFRVSGFPDWYDEVQIVRVIAGVRYATSGPGQALDDLYRMEASVDGSFAPPPGHAYTPTDWNYYTPIVGGGGPSQPPENPDYPDARTLVVPNPATYREVSATLSKNPVLEAGAAQYAWPSLTHEELASTTVRVIAAPDPGAAGDDDYRVELDYAWLDLYGWEKPRPSEVTGLSLSRATDGTIVAAFDALVGAQRYNLYQGRLASVTVGLYDHGASAPAPPLCDATTQAGAGSRLEILLPEAAQAAGDLYFLITAHVDDVEAPAGVRSDLTEIDRSQSVCR